MPVREEAPELPLHDQLSDEPAEHTERQLVRGTAGGWKKTMMCADGWILIVHAAVTLFMTGLIWFVQIVHYPLFALVGHAGFPEYERWHARRTGWVVAGPMLAELAAAIAIAWCGGGALAWLGLALLAIIWLSTGLWQVPAHRRLEAGFDAAAHRRLVRTNWVRTAAWSARGVIALALLAGMR